MIKSFLSSRSSILCIRLYSFYRLLISPLLLVLLGVSSLHAQSLSINQGLPTRINYDNDNRVRDFTIPSSGFGELYFQLNGGDGGRRVVPNLCKRKGGEGATVQAAFSLGISPGQLQAGGTIRVIVGQRGENARGNGIQSGGGGGGTAILYKAPGANINCTEPSLDFSDASTCWVLLAVAGGGGGAYGSGICDGDRGRGGNNQSFGSNSGGNLGGENGNGGAASGGEGGGGYLTAGGSSESSVNPKGGGAGGFNGASGGSLNDCSRGGFGYGGGGAGGCAFSSGGGGGGGFSGGASGILVGGGGGGSFVDNSAVYSDRQSGGGTNSPNSGYVEYQFRSVSTTAPKAICKTTTVVTDANGEIEIDAIELDGGSFDPNGDDLDYCIFRFGFLPGSSTCEKSFSFNCQQFGTEFSMYLIITDGSESSFCLSTVVVEDNFAPEISCEPFLEYTLGPNVNASISLQPEDLLINANDNCEITNYNFSQSTFDCSDGGTHTVTLTAADADENFTSCTTEITINPFTVACAPEFCVEIPAGETEVWVDLPEFAGELGCGHFVQNQVCERGRSTVCTSYDTQDKSGLYEEGEYFIRWLVYDPAGTVVGLCRTYFTVAPAVVNTPICPDEFSVEIPPEESEIMVDIPEITNLIPCDYYVQSRVCETGFNNCTPIDASDKSGSFGPGQYLVEWVLYRPNGANLGSCTTNFTVLGGPVPVELSNFSGTVYPAHNTLDWTTQSEVNNSGFEIERSNDGTHWQKIGFVEGLGQSSLPKSYQFKDMDPMSGYNYYRLKQLDFDGTFEYSKLVILEVPGKLSLQTNSVFPNPTSGPLHIQLPNLDAIKEIKLFDAAGNRLTIEVNTNNYLSLDGLVAGTYTLVIETSDGSVKQKIIKQ